MPFRSSLPDRLVQAIDGFGIERKPSGGHAQNTAIETGPDKLHGSLGEIRKPGQHVLAQARFSAPQIRRRCRAIAVFEVLDCAQRKPGLYEHRLERAVERKPQTLSAMLPLTTYPLLTQPVPTTLGLAATEMRKNRWGIHVLPLRARLASRKAGGCARSRQHAAPRSGRFAYPHPRLRSQQRGHTLRLRPNPRLHLLGGIIRLPAEARCPYGPHTVYPPAPTPSRCRARPCASDESPRRTRRHNPAGSKTSPTGQQPVSAAPRTDARTPPMRVALDHQDYSRHPWRLKYKHRFALPATRPPPLRARQDTSPAYLPHSPPRRLRTPQALPIGKHQI